LTQLSLSGGAVARSNIERSAVRGLMRCEISVLVQTWLSLPVRRAPHQRHFAPADRNGLAVTKPCLAAIISLAKRSADGSIAT
jgi:hypothetical protein